MSLRTLFAVLASAALSAGVPLAAESNAESWLRGSGQNLEIRLAGEAVDAGGQAARDLQVTCQANGMRERPRLKAAIDGHRFELWIPVNSLDLYSLSLAARCESSGHVAYLNLGAEKLRQVAIDQLKLTLREPTRHVQVQVTDAGQPVSGAAVKAEMGIGADTFAKTNAAGIARFDLLPDQALSQLTAWTDDFRVGGYSFGREPIRDGRADEHVVELSKCRDHIFRFVDQNAAPVPELEFVIQMGTPAPDYNYLGTNENSRLTTNDAGDALYRWFPDWEKHHFYTQIVSAGWVLDGDPQTERGTTTFRVKQRKERKPAVGRVTSKVTEPGGFYVTLRSFQGEQKNHSDIANTFADAEGRFTVDVLPDARYCAHALDEKWVSEIIDLVPYVGASDQRNPVELNISAGQEVEIVATIGPDKKPYANLPVHVRREHAYSWQEDGKTRNGLGGPQWYVTTDATGRAVARTLPGKMQITVYNPEWRTEKNITVAADEVARVDLHRENEQKHLVLGHIMLAEGVDANLAETSIQVTAVDGKYRDKQVLKASKHGTFSFETYARRACIFCTSQDGRAIGWTEVTDTAAPVEVRLQASLDFQGQLLGEADRPLADREVIAVARMSPDKDDSQPFNPKVEVMRTSDRTDALGNYTLHGLPSNLEITLYATKPDSVRESDHLGTVVLQPSDTRAPKINRLVGKELTQATPLAERFQKTLLDCVASGYRPLVILANGGDTIEAFVNDNFTDYVRNRDVYDFMQVIFLQGDKPLDAANETLLKEHGWRMPEKGHVLALALDNGGAELGRVELDERERAAPAAAAEFIRRHALGQHDAEQEWAKAFAEAKRSNRRVWARVSQRYCAPCFKLSRWLDEERELLAKDYVMLKIDDFRDLHGADVAKRLTGGKNHGVPFFVIYDQQGAPLADSIVRPLGNVGFSSGTEGKRHLRHLLAKTRQALSDADLDQVVEAVRD